MHMICLNSSKLIAVAYNETSRELCIRFHEGLYLYRDVPREVYQGLLRASSHGQYYNQYIKDRYPRRRLD